MSEQVFKVVGFSTSLSIQLYLKEGSKETYKGTLRLSAKTGDKALNGKVVDFATVKEYLNDASRYLTDDGLGVFKPLNERVKHIKETHEWAECLGKARAGEYTLGTNWFWEWYYNRGLEGAQKEYGGNVEEQKAALKLEAEHLLEPPEPRGRTARVVAAPRPETEEEIIVREAKAAALRLKDLPVGRSRNPHEIPSVKRDLDTFYESIPNKDDRFKFPVSMNRLWREYTGAQGTIPSIFGDYLRVK